MAFDIDGEGGDFPVNEISADAIRVELNALGYEVSDDELTVALLAFLKASLGDD